MDADKRRSEKDIFLSASPVSRLNLIPKLPVSYIDKMPGDRSCGGHHWAHQMSTSASPLAAFEIAVAGRGAALAVGEDVVVHCEAHRATGVAPFETGVDKYSSKTLALRLFFDLHRAGDDHRFNTVAYVVAAGDTGDFGSSGRSQDAARQLL